MSNKGARIHTYSGKEFDIFSPSSHLICIEDIAHSLANKCRYQGHTKHFYSVAQHSVLVSNQLVNESYDIRLAALLHDAAEAYLPDLPSPYKHLFRVEDTHHSIPFYELEDSIMSAICSKFNLSTINSPIIQLIDKQIRVNEFMTLFNTSPFAATEALENVEIEPMGPEEAEFTFLGTFVYLTK